MNLSKNKRRGRKNFTLVEIIVAMGLLVLIALIIGTASYSFYDAWKRSAETTERLRSCREIDNIMDSGVRNMIPYNWTKDAPVTQSNHLVFEGDPDWMLFTALRPVHGTDSSAFLFIKIFLSDGKLVAEWSPYPRPPWELESADRKMEREILSVGVRSVSFLYAMDTGNSDTRTVTWIEDWNREDYDSLPLAVQMTVEWEDGRTERWLRRAAGISANGTFGVRSVSTAP